MTLIISILVITSALFVIMGWANKYSWLVALVIISLAVAMYSVMMSIAIMGKYEPVGIIGYIDEMYFLTIVKNRMSLFTITRLFNVSIAVFVFSLVNFVLVYFNYSVKRNYFKIVFKKIPVAIPLFFYVWFYDKETSFWFYNLILNGIISYDLIVFLDMVANCIFCIYMVWPIIYVVRYWRDIKLSYKRKQTFGILVFVIILNLAMLIIYQMSAKSLYIFNPVESLFVISDTITLAKTQYSSIVLSLLALILACFFVVIRFNIMPKRGIFVRYYYAKDMQKINKRFFSIFHSVKKTIFMYKILAQRAFDEDGERSKEVLKDLINEIDKYISSVSKMQQMNSDPEIYMERLPVSEIIEDTVSRYTHEDAVKINLEYENKEIMVEADSFYLADVFDNIIKNAIEAIKRKKETGSIFISTECEHEWIIIKFKDDGEGISKKEIKNVFKPLYTTKPHGTNWGLGLPFAMKIIKIHMGHMYIESNLGEGTTVSILLPRIAG